jgi:hypothetical protein
MTLIDLVVLNQPPLSAEFYGSLRLKQLLALADARLATHGFGVPHALTESADDSA